VLAASFFPYQAIAQPFYNGDASRVGESLEDFGLELPQPVGHNNGIFE
jgi:hypothetical protein